MSPDLRRFEYVLEPLRQRRQWQLDTLRAELGCVQKALSEEEDAVDRLTGQLQRETARGKDCAPCLDLPSRRHAIAWLVQMRAAIAARTARVTNLRAERDRLRAACLRTQEKVAVMDRHREECVAEFRSGEEARLAFEADREWLVRRVSTGTERKAGP